MTRIFPTIIGRDVRRTIQAFKSLTIHDYIVGVEERAWQPFPGQLWQRNYYEHVIRNEDDFARIREYIQTNPLRWALDRENPAKQGENEFDRGWIRCHRKRQSQKMKAIDGSTSRGDRPVAPTKGGHKPIGAHAPVRPTQHG